MVLRRPSSDFIEPCLPSRVARPPSGPLVAAIDTSLQLAIGHCPAQTRRSDRRGCAGAATSGAGQGRDRNWKTRPLAQTGPRASAASHAAKMGERRPRRGLVLRVTPPPPACRWLARCGRRCGRATRRVPACCRRSSGPTLPCFGRRIAISIAREGTQVSARVHHMRHDVIAMHLMTETPQIGAALVPVAHGLSPSL
jgi:hypothetical protein